MWRKNRVANCSGIHGNIFGFFCRGHGGWMLCFWFCSFLVFVPWFGVDSRKSGVDTTPLSCFCFAVAVERITRPGGVFLEARAKVSLFRFGVVVQVTPFIFDSCLARYYRIFALVTQRTRDSFSSKSHLIERVQLGRWRGCMLRSFRRWFQLKSFERNKLSQ